MIGLSVPEAFSVDDVSAMADDAIVLALANPVPRSARTRPGTPVRPSCAPDAESILPAGLDERVVPAVAGAVAGER